MKKIIQKELEIWKTAYPKQKELLKKFANKIYFELRFDFLSEEKILKLIDGLNEVNFKGKIQGKVLLISKEKLKSRIEKLKWKQN